MQLPTPFGPSMDSLCRPCITTTHLSYSFLPLKLPPPPCAVLGMRCVMMCVCVCSPNANSGRCSDLSILPPRLSCALHLPLSELSPPQGSAAVFVERLVVGATVQLLHDQHITGQQHLALLHQLFVGLLSISVLRRQFRVLFQAQVATKRILSGPFESDGKIPVTSAPGTANLPCFLQSRIPRPAGNFLIS